MAHTSSALWPGPTGRTPVARPIVVALVAGGVAPDVDFVMFWADNFNELHRVVTHSLVFVAVAMLVGGVIGKLMGLSAQRIGVAVAVGALLHLFVDSVMDGNPSNGIGVAYLWPFVNEAYSPFNLVRISEDPPNWNELDRMAMAVLGGVAFELPFYASSLLLYVRRSRSARAS